MRLSKKHCFFDKGVCGLTAAHARPLKRYLQSHAETLIARTILPGDLHAGDTLVVDAEDGALVCRVKA